MNYGLVDVLRRADEKSLVGQNREAFEAVFVKGVKCENRVLRAMQALSEVWFKHLKAGKMHRPPGCLALRVWLRLLL